MNKRQAIIISNLLGMYVEELQDYFYEEYESEDNFLIEEIGLTQKELNDYKKYIGEVE